MARTLAQWADTNLFWTAMAHNTQPAGLADMFANAPPEAAKAFGEDLAHGGFEGEIEEAGEFGIDTPAAGTSFEE